MRKIIILALSILLVVIIYILTKSTKLNFYIGYCHVLSESKCIKNLNCDPQYETPTGCPICLMITYKGCYYNPQKKTIKTICENTGGYWQPEENPNCHCPGNAGKYTRGSNGNLGCLNDEELCLQTQGSYSKNGCQCPLDYHWEWAFGCYKTTQPQN